jgi:hypothetical protein
MAYDQFQRPGAPPYRCGDSRAPGSLRAWPERAGAGQQEWWKTAEQVASDWQFFSQWSEWWELATAPAFGRANELAGLIASAGEQLALGMAATVETELWRAFRDANPIDDTERGRGRDAAEEMGHRAMAELAGYYLLGTGHGLANITARALAMDPEVHPLLLDAVGTWCPPGSAERRDWLSLNRETVRDLRRVARRSGKQVLVAVAEPVTTLVMDDAWGKLGQLCGAHYHRRRPQSAGVSGVPLTSPWEASGIAAMSLNFGGREYTDGDGLAHDTSDLARRVLDGLAATMKTLLERVRDVLEDAQDRAGRKPRP